MWFWVVDAGTRKRHSAAMQVAGSVVCAHPPLIMMMGGGTPGDSPRILEHTSCPVMSGSDASSSTRFTSGSAVT